MTVATSSSECNLVIFKFATESGDGKAFVLGFLSKIALLHILLLANRVPGDELTTGVSSTKFPYIFFNHQQIYIFTKRVKRFGKSPFI